jgi:DNA-binding transcriptional LysR family regulator
MQLSDRIGRRLKLHDLHVLMAVVQAGSMNKAAALLHTTQPAVSRSVAELERTMGVRLLDRNAQGVEPTAYGRALLDGGTAVFDDLRQAVKSIEFLADPTAGEVRVGCSAHMAPNFISTVIARLSQGYPRIIFNVMAAQPEAQQRELTERNVDFVVGATLVPVTDERLAFELLYDESYVVATGAQNPLSRRRRIELAALADEPWMLPSAESPFGAVLLRAFRTRGLDYPRTIVFTHLPELRASLLATGRFVTIFPTSFLRFSPRHQGIKVLPVQLPARVQMGIFTLTNRTLSPAAHLFIQAARELANASEKKNGKW